MKFAAFVVDDLADACLPRRIQNILDGFPR